MTNYFSYTIFRSASFSLRRRSQIGSLACLDPRHEHGALTAIILLLIRSLDILNYLLSLPRLHIRIAPSSQAVGEEIRQDA